MLRRPFVVAIAAALAIALSAAPAAAVPLPFEPPQTLAGGCESYASDARMTFGGEIVGFATCVTPSGAPIRFFSRNTDRSVNPSEATGFVGQVMAVAEDGTGTYVMYSTAGTIRVGKRTNAGAYSSRVVDTLGTGALGATGDIIARGGQWFGVWAERVSGAGGVDHSDLFHAGSSIAPAPVAPATSSLDDSAPALAYSLTTPVLVWSRGREAHGGSSDLLVSKYLSGSWQATRTFASAGSFNSSPDIYIGGGRTLVTWARDGYVWVAGNATGSFVSHRFAVGGYSPKVAASITISRPDHLFVTWASFSGRVFFAQTASTGSVTGTWSGDYVTGPGSNAFPVGAGGYATKGTSVYSTYTDIRARTQS